MAEFGHVESLDDHLDALVEALVEAEQRGSLRCALRAIRPWELRCVIARQLAEGYTPTPSDERAAQLIESEGRVGLLARDTRLEVRLPADLHDALARAAEESGRSLNVEVIAALERWLT